MTTSESGDPRRGGRTVASKWVAKARRIGGSLKAEFEAGARGDDSPVTPLWAPAGEQWERLLRTVRSRGAEAEAAEQNPETPTPDPAAPAPDDAAESPASDPSPADDPAEAARLASALRSVDWAAVRTSVADRSGDVRRRVTTLAAQVDWAAAQPAAARLSSALIAAVAAGRIPVGGAVGATVARAIVDQGGLGALVSDELRRGGADLPPDFRDVVETTATEGPGTVH